MSTTRQRSPEQLRIAVLRKAIMERDYSLPRDPNRFETVIRNGRRIETDSREHDILEWLDLAQKIASRSEALTAKATLIAEIAVNHPQEALVRYDEETIAFTRYRSIHVIALWGRYLAHAALEAAVQAAQDQSLVEASLKDEALTEPERTGATALGRIPASLDAAPRKSVESMSSKARTRAKADAEWLAFQRKLSLKKTGTTFHDAFVTSDRAFARVATDAVTALSARLKQGLKKPANYLLDAAPGSGKSFFVKQFFGALKLNKEAFIEVNVGPYPSVDDAYANIVLEILLKLARHREVVIFVDEVDTGIRNEHMFQKLIALMNGEPLVLFGKQMVFSGLNLVMFFALSSSLESVKGKPKGGDFLSRIPKDQRLVLPALENPRERWVRVMSVLLRNSESVAISHQAMLYLGLRPWESTRELEQHLDTIRHSGTIELHNVVDNVETIYAVEDQTGVNILSAEDHRIELCA
jgi:hypothetical protein